MNIALSIIIPVYNVEKYISECIYSIVNQVKTDVEIILVDDGSTDSSGRICDTFADKFSYISVIHKSNGGLSSARNAGLDKAKGQYIAFVDSDDRIAAGSINTIKEWINDKPTDICFLRAVKFFEDGTRQKLEEDISKYSISKLNKLDVMKHLAFMSKFPGSACTKLFRKAFLDDNNIRFPSDRRLHEDLYFTVCCIDLAATYDALGIPYYEYRQGRIGSITQGSQDRSIKDLILFVSEMTDTYTNKKVPINKEAQLIMGFIAYEYSLILWKYSILSPETKKETIVFLRNYKWILKYNRTKRITIIWIIIHFLGINLTSKVLNYIMKRKKR